MPAQFAHIEIHANPAGIQQDLAVIRGDQVNQQPCGGGFAAAAFPDNAERLTLGHIKADAIHCADQPGRTPEQPP